MKKNPLRKRLPRELRAELGKYLVIFVLLVLSIGFVSGFLVADGSMLAAYNESFQTYRIEDGHFILSRTMNKAQKRAIEDFGVRVYDLFYVDDALSNGSTLRLFPQRQEVNQVCLMQGRFPSQKDEIAVDRMYADNNGIRVGDTISDGAHTWTVTGLVALSDYSALFQNNSDTMFDAVKFGTAVVTPDSFAALNRRQLTCCYAWRYEQPPTDEAEESRRAEDFLQQLLTEVRLEDYVPRFENQAIRFTGEDMGGDRAMMLVLLYLMLGILAFVFAITMSSTIHREANVIGTLLASGYTKGELVRHYMTLPLLVTLTGALTGNALGYTVFKEVCADMYYGSYSLPTYVTRWNGEAFLLTTAVPFGMMVLISLAVLLRRLSLSPLNFLRRDLHPRRRWKAVPLSSVLPFLSRFRLRILFQNASGYAMLFAGILFANLLLMFGLGLPECLDRYQAQLETNLLSPYQYVLRLPLSAMDKNHRLESALSMLQFQHTVETDNETAEKFTAYTLKTPGGHYRSEDVMVYGVEPDSRYVRVKTSPGEAYVSTAFSDKYNLRPGDEITLREPYKETSYRFRVAGTVDYVGAVAVFLDREQANERFDLGKNYFSGYFAQTPLTDLKEKDIRSVIDLNALTKVSRQLDVSMGSMMVMVDAFAVLIFLVLIYLLSRLILQRNAQSISLVKILGYSDGEVARLYLWTTSLVVVVFLLVSIPLVYRLLLVIFQEYMMAKMTGWIPLDIGPGVYGKMLALGVGSYAGAAALEYRKICQVPMDEALKNVE